MTSLAKSLIKGVCTSIFSSHSYSRSLLACSSLPFHTSCLNQAPKGPLKWLNYNDKVKPPNPENTERPPAWVCHMRENIKYSPKKMWYICTLIRGMSVDEAIKQLSFANKKAAHIMIEVIKEAQEMAVSDHNVEYKSNLWIAESFCGKAQYVRGMRRHARARFCRIEYKYCHYFVRLEEGLPPKNYYENDFPNAVKLNNFVQNLRHRTVIHSL